MNSLSSEQLGAGPATGTWLYLRANRSRRLWAQALAHLERRIKPCSDGVCFTYWDTYGGQILDLTQIPEGFRLIRLVDRPFTNPLSNKGSLARLLKVNGLDHLAPATFTRIEEALTYQSDGDKLWFAKPVFGAGGKGIYCLTGKQLEGHELPPHYILQEAVSDLALRNGRKYTSRIYLLVWNQSVYLYRDGFVLTHGRPYDERSTDYSVQVDHRGYADPRAAVRIEPMSACPEHAVYWPRLRALAECLRPVLGTCVDSSGRDRYLLLGVDVLFQRNGGLKLVEINTHPNFVHSDEVNEKVNVPFFEASLQTVLGDQDAGLERVF